MRRWVVVLLAAGCTAGPPSVTVDPTSAPPATTGTTAGTAPGTTGGTAPAPTEPGTTTTPPPGTVVITSLVTSVVTSVVTSLIPAPTTTARPTTTTAQATTTTVGATTTTKPGPIPYTGNLTGDEQAAYTSNPNWHRLTLDAGLMAIAKKVGGSPTAWSSTRTDRCGGNVPLTITTIVSKCNPPANATHLGLLVVRSDVRIDVYFTWGVWP